MCFSKDFLTNDGGPNHIEISQLICRANQWTGFYMLETSFMKELKLFRAAAETYLGTYPTSMVELFRENSHS